ncbi:hypothetical protein TELCIR_04931 [Teladorsagia circumcincta]|uniref:Endonuclease/exonuclease/phosphatase domain-containing protein n=1 Tax=Teladorsagia circumcincta TaxID=45464 RepID=A0A2G9USI7_TELCI|nr:hypothetical protein TELCIR_04931 [Teladorsagia circumcincta]
MAVRIDTKDGYWTIYAPQAGCPESEKDEFYLSLDDAIRSIPDGDYLTIAGDLNGHVGTQIQQWNCELRVFSLFSLQIGMDPFSPHAAARSS